MPCLTPFEHFNTTAYIFNNLGIKNSKCVKRYWSVEKKFEMALLWHYFSVLPKIQNPWLPNRLSMVGGLCCTYDAVWAKLHTVIKQRKIIQKYISHKTEYSRCNYGSHILFMGHIWWMGNRYWTLPLRWHHDGNDSVSNHQPQDCLLNRLFRRRSKKTSKLRVTGLCAGNSPGTSEFPAQMASNTENVSIWWRHHGSTDFLACWKPNWNSLYHDDVIKWKHFPRYWPFVQGIHRWPVNSPHKGQWRGALMFSLICAWINGWVNNREAGDLRCHRAHYDVIVTQNCSRATFCEIAVRWVP